MAEPFGKTNDVARGLELFIPGGNLFHHIGTLSLEQVEAVRCYYSDQSSTFAQIRALGELIANADHNGPDRETFTDAGWLVRELAEQCDLAQRIMVACGWAMDPEGRELRGWGDPPGGWPEKQP